MLDIEAAIIHHHDKGWFRLLCKTLRGYYAFVALGSMPNRVKCDAFVQGLHRVADPELIVLFGGLRDAPSRIAQITQKNPRSFFLIGGNDEEHVFYLKELKRLGIENFINLPIVGNTHAEARTALGLTRPLRAKSVGILTHETHTTQAVLTCVKVAMELGLHIPIVPIAFVDSNRYQFSEDIVAVGTYREAMKLELWQRRRHVATMKEAMEYYRPWLELKVEDT